MKSDVTLEVPPKREVVVYAPLVKKQEIFYTAIVNKTIRKMLGNNQVRAVVMVMVMPHVYIPPFLQGAQTKLTQFPLTSQPHCEVG